MTMKWDGTDARWLSLAAPLWNAILKTGALGKPLWVIINNLGYTAADLPSWDDCKAIRDHVKKLDHKEVAAAARDRRKRYMRAVQGA